MRDMLLQTSGLSEGTRRLHASALQGMWGNAGEAGAVEIFSQLETIKQNTAQGRAELGGTGIPKYISSLSRLLWSLDAPKEGMMGT